MLNLYKDKVIIFAVTVSLSTDFLSGYISAMRKKGWYVIVVSNDGVRLRAICEAENAKVEVVPFVRDPSLLFDIFCLFKVLSLLIRYRPSVVNAGTPKAGFIFMIACWLLRIPIRIYTLHGLRHESLKGIKRKFQIFIDRLSCLFATDVLVVSESVNKLAQAENILSHEKSRVFKKGSCGVQLKKFNPISISKIDDPFIDLIFNYRNDGAIVIGFLGRLIPRKGVEDLVSAFQILRNELCGLEVILVVVGDEEQNQPLSRLAKSTIESDPYIFHHGHTNFPQNYMINFDVFCMPSHWEGFGNVLVEAASLGLPVVSTRSSGCVDAVADGFNGTLVDVGDVLSLSNALKSYVLDAGLRNFHGCNGMKWAQNFDRDSLVDEFCSFVEKKYN